MLIIVLTDCPAKLRGDLSKWLFEINTGVYVGRVSARVREELWSRICEYLKHGQATMVYPAAGEQKMEFRVYNTTWEIADYDGIKLMRRPSVPMIQSTDIQEKEQPISPSKASVQQRNAKREAVKQKKTRGDDYTVVDLETTGLSHTRDHIIEMAALRVRKGNIVEEFHTLVQCPITLPERVKELTGLDEMQLQKEGKDLRDSLTHLLDFLGNDLLLFHHAAFDYGFLQAGCKKIGLTIPHNLCLDTLVLSRQKLKTLPKHSLREVALYFGLDVSGIHRAQKDCQLTYGIYQKLKEI